MSLPRSILPGATYLVTRRVLRRHFLLRPDAVITNLILYALAVSAPRFGIQVHALCAMSTHLHLVVTDERGVLPSFLAAARPIPMVATQDIGTTVARALLDGPRGTRVIELGGPVDVSPNDVAAALTGILGRPVKVAEAPLEAVVPTFTSFGISQNVSELFREMYQGLAGGKVAWEGAGAEAARGITTIEQTLRALTGTK